MDLIAPKVGEYVFLYYSKRVARITLVSGFIQVEKVPKEDGCTTLLIIPKETARYATESEIAEAVLSELTREE